MARARIRRLRVLRVDCIHTIQGRPLSYLLLPVLRLWLEETMTDSKAIAWWYKLDYCKAHL